MFSLDLMQSDPQLSAKMAVSTTIALVSRHLSRVPDYRPKLRPIIQLCDRHHVEIIVFLMWSFDNAHIPTSEDIFGELLSSIRAWPKSALCRLAAIARLSFGNAVMIGLRC